MTGPSWLADTSAAIMIVVAVYCAGRLVVAPAWQRATGHDIAIAHVLMAVAMAGMFVPSLNPVRDGVWEVIFAAGTAWFGWGALRDVRSGGPGRWLHSHYLPHVVHNVAMLYMLLAMRVPAAAVGKPAAGMAGMGAMGGPSGSMVRFPALALVLALFLLGYAIWDADRLTAPVAAVHLAAAPSGAGTLRRFAAGPGMVAAGTDQDAAGTPGPAGSEYGARPAMPVLAPRLAASCRITLGVTMAYMLITML